MATEQEIKTLLDGRKIVDAYVLAKTDRSDPHWVPPSIPELIKALDELGFKEIDDFFLYDSKLSYQEIADVCEAVSPSNELIKAPVCDNCSDRLPRGCEEVMRLNSKDLISPTCRTERASIDVSMAKTLVSSDILLVDPIFEISKMEAIRVGVEKINLCTLIDIILFWNYPGHFAPKCVMTIKLKREFEFDPFWRVGGISYPYVDIGE